MAFEVGGGGKGARPQMNVTPLVDVVLVLLIIFMVVTPLLVKQFYVHLPPEQQPDRPVEADEPQVLLQLDASGSLQLNGRAIERAELPDRLRRIFAAREDDVMFFDATDDAPYGEAVKVMDVCRGAGAITIGLLTEPTKR
jgi:biopolymer transport protein ExbD/biopolymer transport protein TolR